MKNIICTEPCLCMENPCGADWNSGIRMGSLAWEAFITRASGRALKWISFYTRIPTMYGINIRRIDMRSWRTPLKRA